MADDFGDYSGEKLFDWILRMGQDAGGSAAMAALIMSSRSVRIRILFGFDAMTRATWSDVTYSRVEPGQP